MKKKGSDIVQIKKADMELLSILQQVNMLPDKVAVFDSFEGLGLDGYFRLHGIIIALVEKGSCELDVNLNRIYVEERGVFVGFTDQVIQIISMSPDFKPLCVACSENMVEELLSYVENGFRLLMMAKQVPYLRWEPSKFKQIKHTVEYLRSKIQTADGNKFYYQVIKNSVLALAFECVGYMMDKIPVAKISSRKDALFNAFIMNVEKHHREEHSVKFYADELFMTPKYLSAVVDEISGKGAKQWINEYLALDAKVLLRSTKKDIQEISEELNFPDMSFFGKFFRRMTGMSPKAFRMLQE